MLLELSQVSKSYGQPGGPMTPVLRGVDLRVELGQSVAIIGRSGSGKTTLLNLIGTLDRPTSGTVRLGGRDLAPLSDKELASVRRQEIGFVFQSHHLLPQLTVMENVLLPLLAERRRTRAADAQRAQSLLDRVGLAQRLHHRPSQLSGGEQQRVAVVRALIHQPRLLLADEPTGSLDDDSARGLGDLLTQLNREENLTLIVVTHALPLAARMQTQYTLQAGHLVASPLPPPVGHESPVTPSVAGGAA